MWDRDKAKKTQFTTDREESCTASLNVRVPPSLLSKIKERDNWQEFVRKILSDGVDNIPA